MAVLVVHDGMEWLPSVLGTLAGQRYPALDLVVVDNGSSDGSGELLARRIPEGRLITLGRNVGFARAVAEALRHEVAANADLVLLLHDDLVLAPNAVASLVRALAEDPSLAIVGPKLREWSEEPRLQSVGLSADRFGRLETGLEPFELDQGQRDQERDVLFVSTAGMLIRRSALGEIGLFDPRFPSFRDDLDLCWRAWLFGHRVGVVPHAVGYHVAAATRGDRRLGRQAESRHLAERNTVATVLKHYRWTRLLWVLPLMLALVSAKALAFVATRRFTAAGAVVRAYLWNVAQLPATLRRRRVVQRRRVVSDRDLDRLFELGMPRFHSYVETLGSWVAGSDTQALLDDGSGARAPADRGSLPVRLLRRHPVAGSGLALLIVYLVGLIPLLGGGPLVGGQVAAWPESAMEFLRAYASPWSGEPAASSTFASPIQPALGIASVVGFGNAWLAQTLLVLGLMPAAWMLAVRVGRLVTSWPGPRILGATVYVLSPPVLGALAAGRYGALLAATLLPGVVLLGMRVADAHTPPVRAWRAVALLTLALTTIIAAAPGLAVPLAAAALVVWLVVWRRVPLDGGRRPSLRLGVTLGATGLLLAPWAVGLLRGGELASPPGAGMELPMWRALLLVPDVLPGLGPVGAVVTGAATVAVLLAALLLGLRQRPGAVAGLIAVTGVSAVAAWGASLAGVDWVWVPALLLPAALSVGALAVIAARRLPGNLRGHAFGLWQLGVAVVAVALVMGLGSGLARVALGPWEGLMRAPELVPAFVTADEPRVGPYRILLLSLTDGELRWDLMPSTGPSMLNYGASQDQDFLDDVDAAVAELGGGADPRAGARLGVLNVRYVLVDSDADPELAHAMGRQPAVEPLPSGGGEVYRVRSWLPRAAVLPADTASALRTTGDPGPTADIEEHGLDRDGPGLYSGRVDEGELLLVAEPSSPRWQASAAGSPLQREEVGAVNAFALPEDAGTVRVEATGGLGHSIVVALQLAVLLGVVSLALRPPGFVQQPGRPFGRRLPADLEPVLEPAPEVTR